MSINQVTGDGTLCTRHCDPWSGTVWLTASDCVQWCVYIWCAINRL